jgi:hypothetical protein
VAPEEKKIPALENKMMCGEFMAGLRECQLEEVARKFELNDQCGE